MNPNRASGNHRGKGLGESYSEQALIVNVIDVNDPPSDIAR